jgi:hypothetical protein
MKPYLKYYFTKASWEDKSKQEFLSERLRYHTEYGHDGFGSERTTIAGCYKNAENDYKIHQNMKDVNLTLNCVALISDEEKDKVTISEVEAKPEFIEWVNNKENS